MKKHLSKISLIFSNLVPIYGVIYLGWSFVSILYLYWFENIILAFFTILKLLWVKPLQTEEFKEKKLINLFELWVSKIFLAYFFLLHFGLFTIGHGFLLFLLFGKQFTFQPNYIVGIIFMFLSHGVSFVTNYLMPKIYLKTLPNGLMFNDYSRIFIVHITTIVCFLLFSYQSSLLYIIIFTLIKTIIDLLSHIYQYSQRSYFGLSPFVVNQIVAGYKKRVREGTLKDDIKYPPQVEEMINEILRNRGVEV